MKNININNFIAEHITKRAESLFTADIENNLSIIKNEIFNKKILVIGGAGTIGSNFIKSLLPFKPESIIVVDTNENALTELVREIRSTDNLFVPEIFITYPINFGDSIFEKIFEYYKPFDIVANFAAHKHVRSEKDIFSIEAMIQNNLVYAHKLLLLLEKNKPSHFFCVSTDKAANPVNVMGASKKLMEDLVIQYSTSFKCTSARFANVAFSNGSLLDGFIYRIRNNQPLAVPSDVKRYFVSPEESGQICMLACVLGDSGEIFFPKLVPKQLTSFYDITINFLKVMGYEPTFFNTEIEARKSQIISVNKNYPVYAFESNTSGEKLYEEFYTESEALNINRFKSLGIVQKENIETERKIDYFFEELKTLMSNKFLTKQEIVDLMKKYIPNFQHIEKGITLDKMM